MAAVIRLTFTNTSSISISETIIQVTFPTKTKMKWMNQAAKMYIMLNLVVARSKVRRNLRQSRKHPHQKSKKRKALTPSITPPIAKKPWPVKEEDNREEDSEETEEDRDNVEGWRYQDEDDEETEDENL
ncbi:unnamed protein product [Rhodiola kirilowii]